MYHLDFETYSTANLRDYGAYRYASDGSTEVLIFAIADGDAAPLVWDILDTQGQNIPALDMLRIATSAAFPIYAHNAQFEAAICKYVVPRQFGIQPPALTNWRCTAAMARRAAIPSSLEAVGAFLELPVDAAKDKAGKALIRKFCQARKPTNKDTRERIHPGDDPAAFADFAQYCRQDVVAERAVHAKLAAFEMKGAVLDSWQFDLAMNDLGVPVNVGALTKANALIAEYTKRVTAEFRSLVGCSPTQRAKVLAWLQTRGYTPDNLQSGTVDAALAAPMVMAPEAVQALKLRRKVSYAAVKKVPTMLGAVCPDGRVRGTLLWSGAERTHRWAGRIIQPQNFRRPTFKGTEAAYADLCAGADIETLELLYAPFLEVIASCIRHFIQLPGAEMLQADFSSVEARGSAWLCGGQRKLDMFANNEPIYENMAAKIFGIPVADVDSEQRFIGKQAELGCSYNMGRPKFRSTCEGFGYQPSSAMVADFKKRSSTLGIAGTTAEEWLDLTYDDLADRAVTAWRKDNPEIVRAWKALDTAAKDALRTPGEVFKATDKISFGVSKKPGFRALVMVLPNKHALIYPKAKLVWDGPDDETPDRGDNYNTSIQFWGKMPGKSVWGWCSTYGGKLLENATQAVCGDFMANGACNASRAGYSIFMLVHDEALAVKHPGQSQEELCSLLCDLPPWAAGMPLAADGNEIPFYKKT